MIQARLLFRCACGAVMCVLLVTQPPATEGFTFSGITSELQTPQVWGPGPAGLLRSFNLGLSLETFDPPGTVVHTYKIDWAAGEAAIEPCSQVVAVSHHS